MVTLYYYQTLEASRERSATAAATPRGRPSPSGRRRAGHGCRRCRGRRLGGAHVGLLLRLDAVLLVADPLVAEPVVHLLS